MSENIIVKIIENQEKERKELSKNIEWGIRQRNALVKVLEENGANISTYMYDLLLFNINGLRINEQGKVCYSSFYPASKRILSLFTKYNEVIKQNFDTITNI